MSMTMTQADQPRSGDRGIDAERSAHRELADTPRSSKAKHDGLHPSLRALPDYPVR